MSLSDFFFFFSFFFVHRYRSNKNGETENFFFLEKKNFFLKSVDLHPNEPWLLVTLYNGHAHIYNHDTQQLIKTLEICDVPVRSGKFVVRKNWVITASDDMFVRVYNYNTLERVHQFEAHNDYIRSIAVHPTQSYLLTSSDDMTIKLWDWDAKWALKQTFEGHIHYVMQIVINPKDNNTFASASLDRTVKVWQLGSSQANFTLEGHEKGVNCIDYYPGGDKPYLASGGDDRLVKIWDYQNKTCVQTLDGHSQNVGCIGFHPELPIIISGSEDGTVKLWHSNTYRLESTLNYGLERCWTIACLKGSNNVALGFDEGTMMIKLGREEPAMSMDASTGKIVWAKHSEIQQVNLKQLSSDQELKDGEKVPLSVKDMGSCEIYPQTLSHSPNGRFVVVCGDGEFIIYTAITLRNKSYGNAMEFVWSQDSSEYAIRDGNLVKIFKNFKEKKTFKPENGAEGIFGGSLLGVRSYSGLTFYDWETLNLIRRIEIVPKSIFWSQNGQLVCIATEESFYVLRFHQETVAAAATNKDLVSDDGIEDAFDALSETAEVVKTGLWVGDCFIYTNSLNRINYYVGGEIVTISHLDRVFYVLGYVSAENRLYLGDKEMNIVSYELSLAVLEYQTAVMRKDFETADQVLPTIPKEQRTRVAHFLEKQGYRQQALAVTLDSEHKFELALQLGNLSICYDLALEFDNEQKWLQLSDAATKLGEFSLVQQCLIRAQSYGSLLLLASANSDKQLMSSIGDQSRKSSQFNVAFISNFVLGKLETCLEILIENQRLPEAAFFARTYLPSEMSRVVDLWRDKLKSMQMERAAQSLANPADYENLFPGLAQIYKTEQFLKQENPRRAARDFSSVTSNVDRKPIEEMLEAENDGRFSYEPIRTIENDDEENFDDATSEDLPRQILSIRSDRFENQSPMNLTRDSSKAPSVRSTAATVGSRRPASVSDLEKELEDLDIDLDTDDVRNAKNGSAQIKDLFSKTSDENEVNRCRSFLTNACLH
uniref:Coatomer subunit beta' n=1 Tax=Philodina roseola TaxID=96448 RepID=B2ZF96_PHIRO|nr:beta prime coatomer protein complex subunit [Philodina roseola]